MKYFVLKPKGEDLYAHASREAIKVYADQIECIDPDLAKDLRDWRATEIVKNTKSLMPD